MIKTILFGLLGIVLFILSVLIFILILGYIGSIIHVLWQRYVHKYKYPTDYDFGDRLELGFDIFMYILVTVIVSILCLLMGVGIESLIQ